jgi:hypothetical protein
MNRHARINRACATLADLQGLLEQAAQVEVHENEKAEITALQAQKDAEQDLEAAVEDWNQAMREGLDPRLWLQWAHTVCENQSYLESASRACGRAQTALANSRIQLAGLTAQTRSLHKYQASARVKVVRRGEDTRLEAWRELAHATLMTGED